MRTRERINATVIASAVDVATDRTDAFCIAAAVLTAVFTIFRILC